jgi:hypothetical protein
VRSLVQLDVLASFRGRPSHHILVGGLTLPPNAGTDFLQAPPQLSIAARSQLQEIYLGE